MGGDAEGVASVQRALLVPVELVLLDNIGLSQITVPELEVMLSALLSG
jgi:hypothetical protein